MNISGISKAKILAALYNGSKPQGMGFLHFQPEEMTIEEAQRFLDKSTYFDYLKGRVMKIDLATNELRTDLYNRDVGANAAEKIIKNL